MYSVPKSPRSHSIESPKHAFANNFATPPERPITDCSNLKRQLFLRSTPTRENAEVEPFEADYKVQPLDLDEKSESEDQSLDDSAMSETEISPKMNNKKRLNPSSLDGALLKYEMAVRLIKRLKI